MNFQDFNALMRDKFLDQGIGYDEGTLIDKCTEFVKCGKKYMNELKGLRTRAQTEHDFYKQFSQVKTFIEFTIVDIEQWMLRYIKYHENIRDFDEAVGEDYYLVDTEIYFDEKIDPKEFFDRKIEANHPLKKQTYRCKGKLHREEGPAIIEYNRSGKVIKEEYWLDDKQYTDKLKWSVAVGILKDRKDK